MYNSGVIPSEKSPLPLFSKEGLIPPGEIPVLKNGKKGDLSSTSAGAIDWTFLQRISGPPH
jgi:hypothetical protein